MDKYLIQILEVLTVQGKILEQNATMNAELAYSMEQQKQLVGYTDKLKLDIATHLAVSKEIKDNHVKILHDLAVDSNNIKARLAKLEQTNISFQTKKRDAKDIAKEVVKWLVVTILAAVLGKFAWFTALFN